MMRGFHYMAQGENENAIAPSGPVALNHTQIKIEIKKKYKKSLRAYFKVEWHPSREDGA